MIIYTALIRGMNIAVDDCNAPLKRDRRTAFSSRGCLPLNSEYRHADSGVSQRFAYNNCLPQKRVSFQTKRVYRRAVAHAIFACFFAPLNVFSEPAQIPLFVPPDIEPNVMFTLDDSGSMQWEMMPDSLIWSYFLYPRASQIYGSSDYTNYVVSFTEANNIYDKWARSSAINSIYYNPAIRYRPWAKADGSLMSNASTTCAFHNPTNTVKGCRNLTSNNTQSAIWDAYSNGATLANVGTTTNWVNAGSASKTFWPSFYYVFTGDLSSNASKESAANYTRVEIKSSVSSYTGGANRTDCAAAPTCTYAEEIQNFANWYTYYRSRILLARAGVGRAFAEQGSGLRVGFGSINKGSTTIDSVSSPGAIIRGVRKFEGSDRTAFFSSLYDHAIPTSGTPLRRALDDVGQYFSRTDNSGPWSDTPGTSSTAAHLACRQSYNILMTDGYWNDAAAPTNSGSVNATNADNNSGPVITGPEFLSYQYTPANPYQGLNADSTQQNNTLADVAMYYWNRDLRPNIDNLVPTNSADEAFWQHLVNFTVGLGKRGSLDPYTDLPALTAGTKLWPAPSDSGAEENIDDLWHAAVNSRGGFFSATNSDELAARLSSSLQQIVGQSDFSATSSFSRIESNTASLNQDALIFPATFESNGWRGNLLAYHVDPVTGISVLDPFWSAAQMLDTRSEARNIFTHAASSTESSGSPGLRFQWELLPEAFRSYLNTGSTGMDTLGEQRLAYLMGDQSLELGQSGGLFRRRTTLMGDLLNGGTKFVGRHDYGFDLLPGQEGAAYNSFRAFIGYINRPGVVYANVNDGMMHGFAELTGKELIAYVPEAAIPNLWKLTDPGYTHHYFVDGGLESSDAYINGNWQTLLVGATGAGGKSVFALNVTDPLGFDESDVLWEFSSNQDADLGFTIGVPSVVRLANGSWAAVFGNGYASDNNRAVLFIVDLATGSLIRKIDTGAGSATDPNGLSSPLVVDIDGDKIGDRVLAGDLHGNLWVFDLTDSSNVSNWRIAYQSGSLPVPLFSAKDEDGTPQPITSQIQVENHPHGGLIAFFGTGKYFDQGDGFAIRKNTLYGIWDQFSAANPIPINNGRSSLLQQQITHETYDDALGNSVLSDGDPANDTVNPFPLDLRASTGNSIDWSSQKGWFIDLESPLPALGWEGERVVSAPLLRDSQVVFKTMTPSPDPCKYGIKSWSMKISLIDGSRLSVTPYDLNTDGVLDYDDYVSIWVTDNNTGVRKQTKIPVSGRRFKAGSEPLVFTPPSTTFEPDLETPSVTLISPPDGSAVTTPNVTISGVATDCGHGNNGIASVTVDGNLAAGGSATVCDSANWSVQLPLNPGTNNLTITATDASPAANQSQQSLALVYLPLIADDNDNGLPDTWEVANSTTDPDAHSDSDNINDGDEYRAGTDPSDEQSKPEGAGGINYVLLRDHFDDEQYENRWYISAMDAHTNYSLIEAGTELEAEVRQPFADCFGLRFQHFAAVDAVNMVYHATLELDGNGVTVLGLMQDQEMDNRLEIVLDNDLQPHLSLLSSDGGVVTEIPVPLSVPLQGTPLDLRITKIGNNYQVYVNNVHEGGFTNLGLGDVSLRPFVEATSCSTDGADLTSRIDLIELLVDRDADGRADTHEDANADGAVGAEESDPLDPDSDSDQVLDGSDNCLLVDNGNQLDSDNDGFGNLCDCDFNQDGFCGGPDFTLFIGCFNSPINNNPTCEAADMNGDGFVGGPDFTRFISGFNGAPGPGRPVN